MRTKLRLDSKWRQYNSELSEPLLSLKYTYRYGTLFLAFWHCSTSVWVFILSCHHMKLSDKKGGQPNHLNMDWTQESYHVQEHIWNLKQATQLGEINHLTTSSLFQSDSMVPSNRRCSIADDTVLNVKKSKKVLCSFGHKRTIFFKIKSQRNCEVERNLKCALFLCLYKQIG